MPTGWRGDDMRRARRLERWTLVAVLAAAMVYGVRSCVAPEASSVQRQAKATPPAPVTVVFLPSELLAPTQDQTTAAKSQSKRSPPEPHVSPVGPQEMKAEPLVAPLRPSVSAPRASAMPRPLRAHADGDVAVPARPLPAAGSTAVAPREIKPLAPRSSRPGSPVATSTPVPLRPRIAEAGDEAIPGAPIRHEAGPGGPDTQTVPAVMQQPVPASAAAEPLPRAEMAIVEGRALLRILEHGSGPTIDIAWPSATSERERLYRHFKTCFGMKSALMDARGRLYTTDGRPGEPWVINLDRHSGFVRQTQGQSTADEQRESDAISSRHHALNRAAPVRVFPRSVDSLLLGHLRHVVGEGYAEARVIRAAYRLRGSEVAVENIEVDGRRLNGRIDLSPAALRTCSGAASW